MKISFLPNGEVHADLLAVGGYRSPGGAVYKCSNWYKNKIINASGTNSNSNSYTSKNTTSNNSTIYSAYGDNVICNRVNERWNAWYPHKLWGS